MSIPDPAFYRRRWSIFWALAMMYILVYFYRVSLAVVAGDISKEISLSPGQLGLLSGILFYVYAAAQLPLGPAIDRAGGRLVISGCGVLTAVGGILFSQASDMQSAMIARSLIGIGTASVLMATFTIFSHWYSHAEFGRISGLMVAVGNLGNLAATAPLALSVAEVGWRNSFLAIGVVQSLVTALVFLTVQDRPGGSAATKEFGHDKPVILTAWRMIFGKADFLLLGGISFFWYGNYLALQGLWGGPFLMRVLGLSRIETGKMLMFTSIGFIIGSIFIDYVSRRVFKSHKRTLIAGQALLFLLMSLFLGPIDMLPSRALPPLFLLTGIAVSSGVMIYPIIRLMFPLSIVGTALTSLNFFVLMGAAVTQQAMGRIIDLMTSRGIDFGPACNAAFLFPVAGLFVTILCYLKSNDYH